MPMYLRQMYANVKEYITGYQQDLTQPGEKKPWDDGDTYNGWMLPGSLRVEGML